MFKNYNSSCKISENNFFVQDYASNKCYSIDLKSSIATLLPDMPTRTATAAVGCIDAIIYVISRSGGTCNDSYNTFTKE